MELSDFFGFIVALFAILYMGGKQLFGKGGSKPRGLDIEEFIKELETEEEEPEDEEPLEAEVVALPKSEVEPAPPRELLTIEDGLEAQPALHEVWANVYDSEKAKGSVAQKLFTDGTLSTKKMILYSEILKRRY